MDETESKSGVEPQPVAPRSTAEVILASAAEAFGSAVVLWILGGVAIGIAGTFAGDMIPSLPPGFGGQTSGDVRHHGHHHGDWHVLRESAFIFFFAIFFVHSLWVGFHGRAGKRILRILSNLRENWFGLIIGNAIGAWVAVLVLGMLPDFSLWQMLGRWAWEIIHPLLAGSANFAHGDGPSSTWQSWLAWFEANQTKLTFWIIYLGGAFDDLGVPNYKTLARWAWRRMQKRKRMALPPTAEGADMV